MPKTDQDREGRIFLEASVRETEPALIEDRASIGTNEVNMTTALTQPDCFLEVFGHEVSLARVGRHFEGL